MRKKGEEPSPTGNSINKSFILERSRNSLFPPPLSTCSRGLYNLYSKVSLLGSFRRVVDRTTRGGLVYTIYSKGGEEGGGRRQPRNFPARPRSAEPDLLGFLKADGTIRSPRLIERTSFARLWVIPPPSHPTREFPPKEFPSREFQPPNI